MGRSFLRYTQCAEKEGKYPALLRVPGAGVRPYSGDTYTAPGKVITLEVGIHGIPVTMEQSVYDALAGGALNNYWTFGRDSRDNIYYNRVVVGVLRAVDFICSLPQYNGKALGVTGSSQGGALSVITAALDPRVTFFAAVHPALCDHEAYIKKRACGWPHYFYYYGARVRRNFSRFVIMILPTLPVASRCPDGSVGGIMMKSAHLHLCMPPTMP